MRSFVPGLLIVVFALAAFAGLPPVAETARAVALVLCGLWAVAEAQALHKRGRLLHAGRAQADEGTRKLQDELAQAQSALGTTRSERATAQAELAMAQSELAKAHSELTNVKAERDAALKSGDAEVVGFLSLLQQKGRLLDFLMDDVTRYPDAQIGAAARVVHQGCASVVREYFDIKPVHAGAEGTPLTLPKDYDARSYRLLGRVTGEPPVSGRVLHRGWLTTDVRLPSRIPGASTNVIAPAEVELS